MTTATLAPSPGIDIRYEASTTGRLFHRSRARFRGLRGPIGSGKSVTCVWELYRMAVLQEADRNMQRQTRWGVIRNTYPELKSTTIKTWRDWFPQSICPIRWDVPITAKMVLPLEDGTTLDMEVIFVSADRDEDVGKLLSLDLTGLWVNEAKEISWRIVEAAMGRCGRYPRYKPDEGLPGPTRKATLADTNPPDEQHWWYKLAETGRLIEGSEPVTTEDYEFFAQPGALIKTGDGSYAPNPAAENIAHLKGGYGYYLDLIPGRDPEWVKVFVLGQYGIVQAGKPVYGSTYNGQIHYSKTGFLPLKKWPIVLALDFGLTPAALFMQQTPIGQVRAIEEVVTTNSGIRQLCRDILAPLLASKYAGCTIFITGDPAGNQRAQTDMQTAWDIVREELGQYASDIVPADTNALQARLDAVKMLLTRLIDGRPAFVVSGECSTLHQGFMGAYKYRKLQVVGGAERYMETPDKTIHSHVHDACQYGCMYLLGGLRQSLHSALSRPVGARYAAGDQAAGY